MSWLPVSLLTFLFCAISCASWASVVSCPLKTSELRAPLADRVIAEQVFARVFHSTDVYLSGSCNTNIWNYLRLLDACGVSLSSSNVLYIGEVDLDLTLERARYGPEAWYFHVALHLGGKVFDFDYAPADNVPSLQQYFQSQFSQREPTAWQGITLRIVPAAEYLELYTADPFGDYTYHYFLLPERSTYPEHEVPHYLQLMNQP